MFTMFIYDLNQFCGSDVSWYCIYFLFCLSLFVLKPVSDNKTSEAEYRNLKCYEIFIYSCCLERFSIYDMTLKHLIE